MTDAVPLALLDRFEHGRDVAPVRLDGIETRVRVRLDRRRRWLRNTAVVIGAAVAGAVTWQVLAPTPEPTPVDTGPAPVVDSTVLTAVAVPRTPADEAREAQAAAICDLGTVSGPGAGYADAPDQHYSLCRPVWLGEGPLISAEGTTLTAGAHGTITIAWRLRNTSERLLPLELGRLTATVVDAGSPGTTTVPLVAGSGESYGTAVSATSLWTADGRRFVPHATAAEAEVVLEPGRTIAAEAIVASSALDPTAVLRVEIQVPVEAPDGSVSPVVLETASDPWSPIATTTSLVDGSSPRAPATLAASGEDALICPATAADEDLVRDRWGTAATWTPACAPVTLADTPLEAVTVRSDLDRTAYTRVVRWTARNASDAPVVLDVGASTVTLELPDLSTPNPIADWRALSGSTARIDTLWRTDVERTAVIRTPGGGAGSAPVVLAPGDEVSGDAEFFFDDLDADDAARWGPRLERSRAVVQLVVRGVSPVDTVVVVELAEP